MGIEDKNDQEPSVTVIDVARHAGVSPTTISNVINKKFHLMGEKTRRQVEASISELNYRPFIGARILRHSTNFAVGLIIVDSTPSFLTHPAHAHIVTGLSNYLNENGYSIVLQGVRERIQNALSVRNISTDALCVILSGASEERAQSIKMLRSLGQPVVLFHEKLARIPDDTLVIRADEFRGGEMLAEHLLERGCRRLSVLMPSIEWPANIERLRGIKAAAKKYGAPLPGVIHCGNGNFESTQSALAAYFELHELPDAMMATQDQIGIAAMMYLKTQGISVPKSVSITGFNAFEFWKYTDPVLTTVRSPAYELGELAGQHIIERLRSGSFSVQEIVAGVQLLEGGTTASTSRAKQKLKQTKRR
jgi:LacI family transcriptional regulator